MANQEQPDPAQSGAEPAMDEAARAESEAFDLEAAESEQKRTGTAPKNTAAETGDQDIEDDAAEHDIDEKKDDEPETKPKPSSGKPTVEADTDDADKAADAFWGEVAKTHPRAEQDIDDPRFEKFTSSDKRIAKMALSKSPAVAVEVLNAYYEARDAGELDGETAESAPAQAAKKEEPKPATKEQSPPVDIGTVKLKTHTGSEITVADLLKEPDEGEEQQWLDARETVKLIKEVLGTIRAPAAPQDDLKTLKDQVAVMTFWQGLEDAHPGGRKLVTSKECRAFVMAQPPSIQRLFKSNDPVDVAYVADLYEKSINKDKIDKAKGSATDKKRRTDALHSETNRGARQKQTTTGTEIEDTDENAEALFERAVQEAEERERQKARRRSLR